jgi:hypothetical protein
MERRVAPAEGGAAELRMASEAEPNKKPQNIVLRQKWLKYGLYYQPGAMLQVDSESLLDVDAPARSLGPLVIEEDEFDPPAGVLNNNVRVYVTIKDAILNVPPGNPGLFRPALSGAAF